MQSNWLSKLFRRNHFSTKWFCFFQIVSIAIRFCKTFSSSSFCTFVGFRLYPLNCRNIDFWIFLGIKLESNHSKWKWTLRELDLNTGSKNSFSNKFAWSLFSLASSSQQAKNHSLNDCGHQWPIFGNLEKLAIGYIQIKLVFLAWWDLFSKDFQHKNSFAVFTFIKLIIQARASRTARKCPQRGLWILCKENLP